MRYTTIIFDVDGTMSDTESGVLKSWQETVQILTGKTIPYDELRFTIGFPHLESFDILKIGGYANVHEVYHERMRRNLESAPLFPGIIPLLDRLKAAGFNLGVITSRNKIELHQGLEPGFLDEYFPHQIYFDHTTLHKPHPEPMLKYLERSGNTASNSLYIGDTLYDSQCAAGAGVDFALVLWGPSDAARTIPAQYYLKSPADLLEIIYPEPVLA